MVVHPAMTWFRHWFFSITWRAVDFSFRRPRHHFVFWFTSRVFFLSSFHMKLISFEKFWFLVRTNSISEWHWRASWKVEKSYALTRSPSDIDVQVEKLKSWKVDIALNAAVENVRFPCFSVGLSLWNWFLTFCCTRTSFSFGLWCFHVVCEFGGTELVCNMLMACC